MMQVSLVEVGAHNRYIVENLFTAFFMDLSQYDHNIVINEHGLPMWEPAGHPGPKNHQECARFNWWIRDRCEQYIIQVDGITAGFITINALPEFMETGVEYDLLDFYIAPRYRRHKVGYMAAKLAFDLHRGEWSVYQLARNTIARQFWLRVVGDYTGGKFKDHSVNGGTRQRFHN